MGIYSEIGRAVQLPEVIVKARGEAVYTTDMGVPGMLYGKILRSKYPHARILSIDVAEAKRLPGVKAVITANDIPRNLWGLLVKDKPALTTDKVRYVGDEIAGVVATDVDKAEEALDRIKVEYEELPAVFDATEAMKKESPVIHEKLADYKQITPIYPVAGTNINSFRKLRKGDAEIGFKQADFIFEDEFVVPTVHSCALEPITCISQMDAADNITIWSSTQTPYEVRDAIADYLGMPYNKIRVIVPFLGGGFGGKLIMKAELICALMSKAAGRPVKLEFSREEFFMAGGRRPPLVMKIRTGVKKDGKIVARHCHNIWDSGAYADHTARMALRALQSGGGPYDIPNVSVDSYTVYTNNSCSTAFRGYGTNHLTWAIECHMDTIAEKLNIDPLEFRMKNALQEGCLSPTGQKLQSVGLQECLADVKDKANWGKLRDKKPFTGVGIACFSKPTNTPTAAGAVVKLNQDGTAELLISSVDMGQGSHTGLAQMAAEELGIHTEMIKTVYPDTQATPYYGGTAGSRTCFVLGNAVKGAAISAKNQILDLASSVLGIDSDKLELTDGKVAVKGSPEKAMSLSDLPIGGAKFRKGVGYPVIGECSWSSASEGTAADPETGQAKRTAAFWIYGVQMVEVEVDPDTGKVDIKRIISAHNVGKILNPLLLEGQCEGGIAMAIGEALYEKVLYDGGKTINPTFVDYKVPGFSEVPGKMECAFLEIPNKDAPYGNLGMGESPVLGIAGAVTNAVYDAIGVRIKELPLTGERIVRALQEQVKGA